MLTKAELIILDIILDGIDKSLMEIQDNTCIECGTLECVVDYSWNYEASIPDTKENRKIAEEMEKFIAKKYPNNMKQIFEVAKETPIHKETKIFFNSYNMFQYLCHRIKQEIR